MIKHVHVSQLKVGMFVHHLYCPWLGHPLDRHNYLITSDEQIEKIAAAGLYEVYIDTEKGLDAPDAPTLKQTVASLEAEMTEMAGGHCMLPMRTTLAEEMERAKTIKDRAQQLIQEVMQDVRLGNMISLGGIEPVVRDITDSILRNPAALTGLSQIKNKDDYTFMHSVSVGAIMVAFCVATKTDGNIIQQAGIGGLLHDAGKACVPDEILNKPGKLTQEEFAIMQRHPADGYQLLSAIPGIDTVSLDIVRHHHERYNGAGYPDKIEGSHIGRLAQMASIADVYDSVTSSRSYHPGICPAAALRMMLQWSASHFDMQLVKDFMRCVGFYPIGSLVKLESGRLGVVVEQHECNLLTPKVNVFFDTRSNTPLPTQLIDLSMPLGSGGADRIISYESFDQWNIDTTQFSPFAASGLSSRPG